MYFVFADDSDAKQPRRLGMEANPLTAVGGFIVNSNKLHELESGLDRLCSEIGFPPYEEFKWSPTRELWMRKNLLAERRDNFFISALALAKLCDIKAIVVVIDTTAARMTVTAPDAKTDAVEVFLERASSFLREAKATGVVIVDEPGGDKSEERKFLQSCVETRLRGTNYEKHDNMALTVLTAKSEFVRCLQLADVIVGCSTSHVAGSKYTPAVFAELRDCFRTSGFGVIGGAGLKIHPDRKYANLYHWLLGDTQHHKQGKIHELPHETFQYFESPGFTEENH